MIHDLEAVAGKASIEAEICIVGAGIAGLLLATHLRSAGVRVAVIESGGRSLESEEHVLNEVVNLGMPYHGAARGRARCLGGTSTRWGGALIPFLEADLGARPYLGLEAWPVPYREVSPYIDEVEQLFGVVPGPYDARHDDSEGGRATDIIERLAKWPTFRNRNVATLLAGRITADDDLSVWVNATVCRFGISENGRLRSLEALSLGGRKLVVQAETFVLCPGAIEATRLLLMLDRQSDGRVFAACDALGRYFYDHISVVAARLLPPDPAALNRLAGFRFSGRTMRSPRFELAPRLQADACLPSAFAHISFQADGPSGFDALRGLLRSMQQRGRPDPSEALRLLSDLPYLVKVAAWRFGRKQLLWPSPATYHLHIVAEQLPRASNRITLSDECDPLGCPKAALSWMIEMEEQATIRRFAQHFEDYWQRSGHDRLARLEWHLDEALAALVTSASPNDIYHPGGTTRMGHSPRTSVVDASLRVHALENLFVSSTSVFPSGASANPTLMLMAFTLRLADWLAARSNRAATRTTAVA